MFLATWALYSDDLSARRQVCYSSAFQKRLIPWYRNLKKSSFKRNALLLQLWNEEESDSDRKDDLSDLINLIDVNNRFSSFFNLNGGGGRRCGALLTTAGLSFLVFVRREGSWWYVCTARNWSRLWCTLFCNRVQYVCPHLLLHLRGNAFCDYGINIYALDEKGDPSCKKVCGE